MHTTIAAIVYDLDGTLVDSASTVAGLLNALRTEKRLSPLPVNAYYPWISLGGKAMIAAALNIPETDSTPLLEVFRARYLALPTAPESVYPNVHQTLGQLKSHDIKLGLCTNKPRALTEKVLQETGLNHYFSVICAGNDLSTRKPHPDNLQVCLSALNSLPAETMMVGDSRVDQSLAEACGTPFAFFRGGYDDGVCVNTQTLVIEDHLNILNQLNPSYGRQNRE